jgi:hypothetical protein
LGARSIIQEPACGKLGRNSGRGTTCKNSEASEGWNGTVARAKLSSFAILMPPRRPGMTPKKVVQQLLEVLPESCTYEDIKRHLELFDNIRRNQEAVILGAKASLEIERYPEQ